MGKNESSVELNLVSSFDIYKEQLTSGIPSNADNSFRYVVISIVRRLMT